MRVQRVRELGGTRGARGARGVRDASCVRGEKDARCWRGAKSVRGASQLVKISLPDFFVIVLHACAFLSRNSVDGNPFKKHKKCEAAIFFLTYLYSTEEWTAEAFLASLPN